MSTTSLTVSRRNFLARISAALSALAVSPGGLRAQVAAEGERFSHDVVLAAANTLASNPYVPPMAVPEALLALDYDQYRSIRYRKQAAIWGNTPSRFSIELFAPGNLYASGIDLSVVESGQAIDVPVENDTFEAENENILRLLAEIDKVAGFRLHYPLNNEEYQDEFVVFQGASYFRAVSRGQTYGLSARGLAIDVAEPTGEEFPIFRKFWIERPSSRADSIVVHALLDSPRVSGAYRFGIYPDDPTRLEVEATLFARTELTHIGLGSLTSMFLFGGLDGSAIPDYRNAVHDSSGLAMLTGQNEYLWRPLNNPDSLQISSFIDRNPKGFGLTQRARQLEDFEDLQAMYHNRPSSWVSPRGEWGDGHVVLVEIPTRSEANDNIVAYWRPRTPLLPGEPFHFEYHLSWPDDSPLPRDFSRVDRTAYGLKLATEFPQMAIDYTGLPEAIDLKEISFETSLSAGALVENLTEPKGTTGARLFITFDPQGAQSSEIRVQPRYQGAVIGETLLYRWLER